MSLLVVDYLTTAKLGLNVNQPCDFVFSKDGRYVWAAINSASYIFKIDAYTDKLVSSINPGGGPQFICITPDGKYVFSQFGTGLCKIDTTLAVLSYTSITLPASYQGAIGLETNGVYIWYVHYSTNKVVKLNATSPYAQVSVISVITGPYFMRMSPLGTYLITTGLLSNLSIITAATNVVNNITLTNYQPREIVFSADELYAWVVCQNNGNIIKINLTTKAIIPASTIVLPTQPTTLAISSDGNYLWTGSTIGGQMSTIYIPTNKVVSNVLTTDFLNFMKQSPDGQYLWGSNWAATQSMTKYVTFLLCFKEDTKILTNKGYIPIQELNYTHLVKTSHHGFKKIHAVGHRKMSHMAKTERIKDQLYKCSQKAYPELFEDLVLTGCHSILVDNFISDEQKEKTCKVLNDIYITDDKYRLPACVDERASVYEIPGDYTIYNLALENGSDYENYGVYANGLLVETCSKRFLKDISCMNLCREIPYDDFTINTINKIDKN